MRSIPDRIASEIAARPGQVTAAIQLLDDGATVPFIARYRKEATGGLDDTQLRALTERLSYLRELEDRRAAVLESIRAQDKLSPTLEALILAAETKVALEDLYLPYKQKRRTKAQIAREAGLEPLADALLRDPSVEPLLAAEAFVDPEKGVADCKAALDGARAIVLERVSEDAALLGNLRDWLYEGGVIAGQVVAGKEKAAAKYHDYFEFSERLSSIPSHRTLALFRARAEGFLDLTLNPPGVDAEAGHAQAQSRVAVALGVSDQGRPGDAWCIDTARLAWRAKLLPQLSLDLFGRIRERAEDAAIVIFGVNMRDLLLSPPAGRKVVMGLDPGIRTGVKVAIVDDSAKVVYAGTIFPHAPRNQWDESIAALAALCSQHQVDLVAIGNGTGSRETEQLVADVRRAHPDLKADRVVVSEAGASVYSASEVASREFPEMDVSLRGAVSIARRLQDPLAELVKIDPKAIGVGQYQHDVNQIKLGAKLDAVVEDCVNSVGVDLNTASAPLLARVAGLGPSLAENIVKHRDTHGRFENRAAVLEVPRLGPKAYVQAAGFLRIPGGSNPLDASAVHPESYPVVERIAADSGKPVAALIGDTATLRAIDVGRYSDGQVGEITLRDIIKELEKPGRDPRPTFKTPKYVDGVTEIRHLKVGMIMEGVVSNVAAFGAFVDLGVHQDGLVHLSQLAKQFIKDPRDVVKTGQIVKVKVLEVDIERKRIALTMRLDEPATEVRAPAPQQPARQGGDKRPANKPAGDRRPPDRDGGRGNRPSAAPPTKKPEPAVANSAFADALKAAIKR